MRKTFQLPYIYLRESVYLKLLPFIILSMMFIFSCSYELPDDHFVEIAPPADMVEIELTLFEPGDTVVLGKESRFNYNFDLKGKRFLAGKINLQEKTWDLSASKGSFLMNPLELKGGYDTLHLTFYFSTGTGSIADRLDAEGYVINASWIVYVANSPPLKTPMTYHIGQNGKFIIEWPEPEPNFEYHILKVTQEPVTRESVIREYTISDPEQTHFIDSCYHGRTTFYQLYTYAFGYEKPSVSTLRVSTPSPEINLEEIGFSDLKASWEPYPFPAKYTLSKGLSLPNTTYLTQSTDNSVIIPEPVLGSTNHYKLIVYPITPEGCMVNEQWSEIRTVKSFTHGIPYGGSDANSVFKPHESIIYVKDGSNLKAFHAGNMELIKSKEFPGSHNKSLISSAPGTKKIAILIDANTIGVIDGLSLNITKTVKILSSNLSGIFLLNDQYLAYSDEAGLKLVNLETKNQITVFDHPGSSIFSISSDMRYAASIHQNTLFINEIIIEQGVEYAKPFLSRDNPSYNSIIFNPTQPNQIILSVQEPSGIEIRSISDFGLVRTINTSKPVILQNIDEGSQKLLVKTMPVWFNNIPSYAIILDIESGENLMKRECISSNSLHYLHNKWLLMANGHYLNLSKYIP